MKWGVRATFVVLRNYIKRHKLNTVRKIISRWAPSNENNTYKYIEVVCQRANLKADEVISFDNTCQMIALFQAMCFVENGREIAIADVIDGRLLCGNR